MEIVILSLIAGTGLFFTLSRVFKWRTLMKYHIAFDVTFTLGLPWLFAGSFNGMVLAALSGIILSLWLFAGRLITPKSLSA